jgi:hypothetical protein
MIVNYDQIIFKLAVQTVPLETFHTPSFASFQTITEVVFLKGALNDDHLAIPSCHYRSCNHLQKIFYSYPIMHALSTLAWLLLFPLYYQYGGFY